jgi:hypothetical protein
MAAHTAATARRVKPSESIRSRLLLLHQNQLAIATAKNPGM